MIENLKLFDPYNRQARLYPALLTMLAPLIVLLAWFPHLFLTNVGGLVLGIAASCGLLFLLADLARGMGKRIEPALLGEWGGWPTTQWLRYRDTSLPAPTKARYHDVLGRKVPQISWPTSRDEATHPDRADATYASSIDWLREHCRGPQHALVHAENATYGFRRNLLGIRPVGLSVSVFAVAASVVASLAASGWPTSATEFVTSISNRPAALFGTELIALGAIFFWVFVVRKSWVRKAGDQYAKALLAACETLP